MHAQIIEIAHEQAEHRFLVHHGPQRAPVAPALRQDGTASIHAIVLVAGQPTSLRVRVALAAPAGAYRLEAHLGGTPLLVGHVTVDAGTGPAARDVEVHVAHPPAGFAVVRGADLAWQLIEHAPGGAHHALPAPPLELVWLPAPAAPLLARGIPLELVHTLADALEAGGHRLLGAVAGADALDPRLLEPTVDSVVSAIFQRGRPAYDSQSGEHHYTDIPSRDEQYDFDRVTLLLSRYLHDPVLPCNCYDIAAVLQFFLRVIGVQNVAYCYMNPFGYLKRAGLTGIGQTNNPFFMSNNTEKTVPERDPQRTPFYNHAFCRLDGRAVADACAGPHLGDQGSAVYATSATDGEFPEPPNVRRGTVDDMTDHAGVVHVDTIVSGRASREHPLVREFIARVGYREPPQGRAVACAWPGPLDGSGLDAQQWHVAYEEIIPGEHEVHRHWSLAHAHARLTIGLYVATDSATAQERFLAIGSTHSFPGPIFDPVPGWPGHAAAMQQHAGRLRLVWLHHNVVCDVMVMHGAAPPPVTAEDLGRWLLAHAEAAVTDDLTPHRPAASVSAVSRPVLRVGERTRIDVQCDAGHVVDFIGTPAGLRLVARGRDWFELVGTAPATDTLLVVVIEPRTLLHHTENITVVVSA